MPVPDAIHDAVRNALIKDGWTITDDPYVIEYEDATLFADLGAEKSFAAARGNHQIVVEVKSFGGPSPISEFERALGQYEIYRSLLDLIAPDCQVYLAVSTGVYSSFFSRASIQVVVQRERVALLVVDVAAEEVVQWINSSDTET